MATEDLASPWKRPTDRQRELKRAAVLRTVARVFNDKGFHAASLDEVADRLHLTLPTLCDCFKSRDEILFECVRLGLQMVRDGIAEVDRAGPRSRNKS